MSASRRSFIQLPMKVVKGAASTVSPLTIASTVTPQSIASTVTPLRVTDEQQQSEVYPVTRGGVTVDATYWRSLEALAETDETKAFLHREFQEGASELEDPMSRRKFLGLMGASMSLAALSGCRKPLETIVPYVKTPEETVIGRPEQYATSAVIAGSVMGLLVTSREGRPIKIDGNELHPSSRGGSNAFAQAEILNLYDPDRSRMVKRRGVDSDWGSFVNAMRELRDRGLGNRGAGLAVVSEEIHSPTLRRLKQEFLSTYPLAIWAEQSPISDEQIRIGFKWALGGDFVPAYDFGKAKVIVSFGSDFLNLEGNSVLNARQFADGRRVTEGRTEMNRLYAVESNFSVTGAMADHRLRSRSVDVAAVAANLALELSALGVSVPMVVEAGEISEEARRFVKALARDLVARKGESLIVGGRGQRPALHMLVAAMNEALGNVGASVGYVATELPSDGTALSKLAIAAESGAIETLIVLGVNPAYSSTEHAIAAALANKKIPHVIQHSSHLDETSALAEWHIPQAHFLETWGDARSNDGTLAIQQPLIEPLFGGKSTLELIGLTLTGVEARGYDLVRDTWSKILPPLDFEKAWRKVLHDGVIPGSASSILTPSIQADAWERFVNQSGADGMRKFAVGVSGIEIVFQPSTSLWDGRYANNGWLQELPDPMTKIVWDNAALISAKTAEKLGVESEDVVKISIEGNSVEAPVFILPGHADDSITLPLGYGRKGLGKVAEGAGFNAYPLRTSDAMWVATGVSVQKTGKTYKLATTQVHGSMEGRPIVREGTLEEYKHEPHFAAEMVEAGAAPSLWKEHTYAEGNQWGMTIDLNTCIGCNACTIACQSENNIPIVGKDQVLRGREMHWIRLDRYFTGSKEDPQAVTQPVGCQQCEMAPCEQVCPAAATSHDHEGLNVMTYNRCIGTRYCSNNCPYKVRRFNFFNFTSKLDNLVQMAQNPDVTVRSRGVMEKCTYCVQRINRGKHNAKMENRDLRDGEITTACEAACPTKAIVFGNINDPESRVAKMKKEERRYDLLAELNTRPRTSYLAKIRNPNPELEEA